MVEKASGSNTLVAWTCDAFWREPLHIHYSQIQRTLVPWEQSKGPRVQVRKTYWCSSFNRSISIEKFAPPDPLLRKACADIGITDVMSCLPKYTESIHMWIDPGEVIVRTTWSYCPGGTEEVLFSSKPTQPVLSPETPSYYPITKSSENRNKNTAELWNMYRRMGDTCGVVASA